jgi:hypothetical protein
VIGGYIIKCFKTHFNENLNTQQLASLVVATEVFTSSDGRTNAPFDVLDCIKLSWVKFAGDKLGEVKLPCTPLSIAE